MGNAVGIRLDRALLKKVDTLRRDEALDRSTMIRKLLSKGIMELAKEKAAQHYREGNVTFSEAADQSGLSLWDFQHYLVDKGFVSSYSLEDLEEELQHLRTV